MDAVAARDAESLINAFRDDLRAGRPWFEALLDVVAMWDIPAENVDGRDYCYLIGGEAFDWLVLAERLCEAVTGDGLLPLEEVEALLLREEPPEPISEEAFEQRLGPAKYRAHLNFIYGVRVEEALQLTVEQQVHKERGGTMMAHDARMADGDVCSRIYGSTRMTLLREFRASRGQTMRDRISLTELKEFTYWLFKKRIAVQDPARVASDTRRGLLTLHRLEEVKRQKQARSAPAPSMVPAAEIIEAIAVPVP